MLIQQPRRKLCANCNISLAKPNGKSKHGFQKWHKYCASCAKGKYNKNYEFLQSKRNKCEKCGFIAEDKCQLSLIYKDGNKNNKEKNNVKTFCANCSKLHYKKLKDKTKSIYNITTDTDITI